MFIIDKPHIVLFSNFGLGVHQFGNGESAQSRCHF